MRKSLVGFALLALVLVSCSGRTHRNTVLYQGSSQGKPIVAVLPTVDARVEQNLAWTLSAEYTQRICDRLDSCRSLYRLRQLPHNMPVLQLNNPNPSALGTGLHKEYAPAEFLVVTELINHREELKDGALDGGVTLSAALRVRVIDIRCMQPKVILQEIVCTNQPVALQYDYSKHAWMTPTYERTPLGLLHTKMVRELVSRVEGYISAAR